MQVKTILRDPPLSVEMTATQAAELFEFLSRIRHIEVNNQGLRVFQFSADCTDLDIHEADKMLECLKTLRFALSDHFNK